MELILDGVRIKVTPGGRVYWSDSWGRIDELEAKGYLRHEHYGPETYGHVDYFLVGGGCIPVEIVHHRDGDPTNNLLTNLELRTIYYPRSK